MLRQRKSARSDQAGLSLVELLVGIAVGLFIVAAAATMVSTQLADNRRMLLELQVQQDLRATADIITRDLRRIGATGATGMTGTDAAVWSLEKNVVVDTLFNTLLAFTPTEIQFNSTRQLGQIGPYGYKLATVASTGSGVIKARAPGITGDGWADLTDADAVNVTEFQISTFDEPEIAVVCPKLCLDGTKTCWPTITIRSFKIHLRGQSRSDASVVREVNSIARLRNDYVQFKVDPAYPETQSCPL